MTLHLKKSMDKRFTYLVEKFPDDDLTKKEKTEFEKYLRDPLCADYLRKAKIAEKIIDEGMYRLLWKNNKYGLP